VKVTTDTIDDAEATMKIILHILCIKMDHNELYQNFLPGRITSGKPIFRAIEVPVTRCG